MLEVRTIGRADYGEIVRLTRLMQQESPHYAPYNYESSKIIGWCNLCQDHPDWICLIAYEDGVSIGFLAAGAVEMLFSTQKTVDDLAFYVVPEKRGTSAGVRLLNALVHWATLQGAAEIRMGVTTGIANDRVSQFLERKGFEQTGTLMTHKLRLDATI